MPKLNNLSRQHLSERPVMGGWRRMERKCVWWMSEWWKRGVGEWWRRKQWRTMYTHTHANRNRSYVTTCVHVFSVGVFACDCTCIDRSGEELIFGVAPESVLTCMLICSSWETLTGRRHTAVAALSFSNHFLFIQNQIYWPSIIPVLNKRSSNYLDALCMK